MAETGKSVSERAIRPVAPSDTSSITRIYNHYIQHSTATFEEVPVSEQQIAERINKVTARYPWLVATEHGVITGYTYAGPWKERSAYRFSCETSIYLKPDYHGRGTGSALYDALLEQLSQLGLRTAIGIVTLPNSGSEKLHTRFGFERVGHFKEMGFKFGKWLDTSYWQKSLETTTFQK